MKFLDTLKNIGSFLTSRPSVGGLEISSSAITYLVIRGSRSVVQASVQLAPGVLEQGLIKDRAGFTAALKQLHAQLGKAAKMINVVLVVPSALVYVQPFSVPMLAAKEQEQAIDLNLQMLSPGKIEESYYDWQEIKENTTAGHLDLLSAFASSQSINDYTATLKEAGFNVVSVEFPGLSLSRLVNERWGELEKNKHYLLVYINTEGILMLILKNGNLYFNHFTAWAEVLPPDHTEQITFEAIHSFIATEMERVLHFYLGRGGEPLQNAILISPLFNYELVKLAQEKFSLSVQNLSLSDLSSLSPIWFPALGAALRGLIARPKDNFISLTQATARTEYYHEKTLTFISIWRNIVLATLLLVSLSFLTVDTIFSKTEKEMSKNSVGQLAESEKKQLQTLSDGATQFNRSLALIEAARSREVRWSPFFSAVTALAGTEVTLSRIFSDRSKLDVLVSGQAISEDAAINFKNQLSQQPQIEKVSLPLSDINAQADKSVSFTLTFHLKSLEF